MASGIDAFIELIVELFNLGIYVILWIINTTVTVIREYAFIRYTLLTLSFVILILSVRYVYKNINKTVKLKLEGQ